MQSQQKRVKWSRGETAEALEERTDTGITQASVELMENCIPDIYGNISRRPGLKILNGVSSNCLCFSYDKNLNLCPFYITENDYILVAIKTNGRPEFMRIKNNTVTGVTTYTTNTIYPQSGILDNGSYIYRPISYAQQYNYMIIATATNIYKLSFTFGSGNSFTPVIEIFKFSAGWYAANGTQTKQVTNVALPGLSFDGHFTGYTYTNIDGTTTVYSLTDTGLTGQSGEAEIKTQIPVGSIVQLPNIGTYFRIEGYVTEADHIFFPSVTFDTVERLAAGLTPTQTGKVCVARVPGTTLEFYQNGALQETQTVAHGIIAYVKCSAYGTGYAQISSHRGAGIWYFTNWGEGNVTNTKVYAFGSLLTPVADDTKTDSSVKVEYNYESLEPTSWGNTSNYPHPTKLTFLDQKLWAGGWATSTTQQYSIVIGSQIARYNDFKNDYNQTNEPITLDILTKFKEKVLHLIDYNGLKIMTEAYEYAYIDGRIVKQSANGSFEYCEPLVFDSLCLYIDSTGCQVKAMQYEFQNSVFNSTTINQMAPHDLVWYPWCMAQYEDRYNSTGKHLFLINREDASARLAVCNFVPGNQAEIWNRWTCPTIKTIDESSNVVNIPFVHTVVNTKQEPIFMVKVNDFLKMGSNSESEVADGIIPAVLDFNANTDLNGTIDASNRVQFGFYQRTVGGITLINRFTLVNTQVAIYSNGEFQFITITNATGTITDDLTGLTNITVGLPINAKVVSHPIDVGGKTKTIKKRIAKTVLSVHNTEANAITINGKTGYINPQKDKINFYGVTGMKDEIKYILTNINGAKFTIESATMNIEYGTLIS